MLRFLPVMDRLKLPLRPRFQELSRVLGRLHAVEGLQTTRHVGTAQAYLAVGLKPDGILIAASDRCR